MKSHLIQVVNISMLRTLIDAIMFWWAGATEQPLARE